MPGQSRKSLARAAGFGGAGGLLLGGLALLAIASRTLFFGVDCAALTAAECTLETTVAREMALRQTLFGGGLALLGLSLLVLLRRPASAAADP